MKHKTSIKTFSDLSEQYSIWIIKYNSSTFESPLFLIWYTETDENSTDRLLTFKTGEIFSVKNLIDLKSTLLFEMSNLIISNNLESWLSNFRNLEVIEYTTYDINSVEIAIQKNKLEISIIETFVDYTNLYDDFIKQDKRNAHLHIYLVDELIQETKDYFYEYIFWPRFNDNEKFEAWDKPQLSIDIKELLIKLRKIINTFDSKIKLTYPRYLS